MLLCMGKLSPIYGAESTNERDTDTSSHVYDSTMDPVHIPVPNSCNCDVVPNERANAASTLIASRYPIIEKNFKSMSDANTDDLFRSIEEDLKFLEIKYGEVLIFNQALPHGNRVNLENESRWSMNCRFKAVFTPYGDKKIGEFFEPISLKPASICGLNYNLPALG